MTKKILINNLFLILGILFFISTNSFGEDQIPDKNKDTFVERIEKIQNMLGIRFSGAIEVEGFYEDFDFYDPEEKDQETSDISLATVEFGIGVNLARYVSGGILFSYEEDSQEHIQVDEATITLGGRDTVPFFLTAGKQTVPFGNDESYFISDPLTLELSETKKGSVVFGYKHNLIGLYFGLFNGDVEETGKTNNHIDTYVANATFILPERSSFSLAAGMSFISNIAESDALSEEIETEDGSIKNHIDGYAVYTFLSFNEKWYLIAQVVGAMQKFQAEELSFDNGLRYQPFTFHLESGYHITDKLLFALGYGGSDDGGDFIPEHRYKGVITYEIFDGTFLSTECQYYEFETKDKAVKGIIQLAIEF